MHTFLRYCLLATLFFSLQQIGSSAVEASEGPRVSKRSNVSYLYNQSTGSLTLNITTRGKSELVFVSVIKTVGSSAAAGPDMFMDRLTVVGGTGTFKLNLSDLTSGTYTLSVSSTSVDFEDQLQIF